MSDDHLPDKLEPPGLDCWFPVREHPDTLEVEAHVLDWVRRSGLCVTEDQLTNCRRAAWGRLACLMYSRGDLDRLKLASEFLTWYSQYDEAGFEQPMAEGRPEISAQNFLACQRILDDPTVPLPSDADPYHHAWRDIWLRMRAVVSPNQMQRLVTFVSQQFLGSAAECLHSVVDVQPSVRDYLEIRRLTSCAGGFSIWIEIVAGYEIPADVWSRPDVLNLVRLVSDIYGSFNDVISLWRDVHMNRPVTESLVAALARERGLTLRQAALEATRIHRAQTEMFIALSAELARDAGPELTSYLHDLEPYLSGFDHWHRSLTERYFWTNEFRSPSASYSHQPSGSPSPAAADRGGTA